MLSYCQYLPRWLNGSSRDERFGDDVHRLVEARVGLLHRDAEARELVPAIALADAEIEPSAGQQVKRRGLLGQQDRVVPRQDQHGGAEAQRRGARAEPGQQVEAGRDLAEAGEMVLDDKGAVKAERLGLDIVLDPLAEALAAVGHFRAGAGPPRLRAAEKSETHLRSLLCEAPLAAAARLRNARRYPKCCVIIAAIARRHRRAAESLKFPIRREFSERGRRNLADFLGWPRFPRAEQGIFRAPSSERRGSIRAFRYRCSPRCSREPGSYAGSMWRF